MTGSGGSTSGEIRNPPFHQLRGGWGVAAVMLAAAAAVVMLAVRLPASMLATVDATVAAAVLLSWLVVWLVLLRYCGRGGGGAFPVPLILPGGRLLRLMVALSQQQISGSCFGRGRVQAGFTATLRKDVSAYRLEATYKWDVCRCVALHGS